MKIELPIATVSEANRRDHWAVKAKRVAAHKRAAWALCPSFNLPCIVTITRVSPRLLDSHDNLRSALKATVDGIAVALNIDDRDPRVEWRYAQAKGKPAAVVVEFQERAA